MKGHPHVGNRSSFLRRIPIFLLVFAITMIPLSPAFSSGQMKQYVIYDYDWEHLTHPASQTGWLVNTYAQKLYYSTTYYWRDDFTWNNVLNGTLRNTNARLWRVMAHGNINYPNPWFESQSGEIISCYLCNQYRNHKIPFVELWPCFQMNNQAEWPRTLGIPPIAQGYGSRTSFVGVASISACNPVYFYEYGFWIALASNGWKMGNAWDNAVANLNVNGWEWWA
ncbi:MAG: hypothetical protein PHO53_04110, partial [Actinomycetota bacterium]|nr:hypothetical protein [Actinomycetota bacterium]